MFFFLDDSDFSSENNKTSNIFLRGGFIVSQNSLSEIEKVINDVKRKNNIPYELPVKWNIKDVRSIYTKKIGPDRYENIKAKYDDIRLELFNELQKHKIGVLISVREMFGRATKESIVRWAFTDLLQRFALEAKKLSEETNLVVLDWESEKSKIRDIFCEVYSEAYMEGKNYHAGALKNISYPFIGFSVTNYNALLQLSDLIVGCFGHFYKCIMKSETPRKELVQQYKLVEKKLIRSNDNKKIFGYGIIIQPERFKYYLVDLLSKFFQK